MLLQELFNEVVNANLEQFTQIIAFVDYAIGVEGIEFKDKFKSQLEINNNLKNKFVEYSSDDYLKGLCYKHGWNIGSGWFVSFEQDKEKAFKCFERAASIKHTEAQYQLAVYYLEEKGVEGNENKAAEVLKPAAAQGHANAQYKLASLYLSEIGVDSNNLAQGVNDGFKLLVDAANQNHMSAQNDIRDYCLDLAVGSSLVDLLILSANQGHTYAQYLLGTLYLNGTGVAQNIVKAVYFLTQAADQGYVEAQCELGIYYLNGTIYVPRDATKAIRLFMQAANQDDADAQYLLGMSYLNGTGVHRDAAKAVKLLARSANQGHMEAQYDLAHCYFKGVGVVAQGDNTKVAIRLLELSANQGHMEAQYDLAKCYLDGIGVNRNEVMAVELLTQAADQGHDKAKYQLAVCTLKGTGVDKDETEAIELVKQINTILKHNIN